MPLPIAIPILHGAGGWIAAKAMGTGAYIAGTYGAAGIAGWTSSFIAGNVALVTGAGATVVASTTAYVATATDLVKGLF